MEGSPAKKAKIEVAYVLNLNEAVDKAWESKSLTEIAEAPISALQGLAEWTDAEFAKLGLSSISELGNWKFFLWARALCKLAETEQADKRREGCLMNVNNAVDKAHRGKALNDVLNLPPSALRGLAEWVDEVLGKLKIKTIQQLGTWKFAEWANAIAVLMPLEVELPPAEKPKTTPAVKTKTEDKPTPAEEASEGKKEDDVPAEKSEDKKDGEVSTAKVDAKPDSAAVEVVNEHGDGNITVTAHYKLALVDIEQNMDKYYVLQTLQCGESYYCVTRWGRTGTKGQAKVDGPLDTAEEAAEILASKFKEKTGNDVITVAAGTFDKKAKKYNMVLGDHGITSRSVAGKDGGCLWQYYVDDGVDGKRVGWYNYAKEAAEIVEGIYCEWQNNAGRGMSVRSVQSGTFCYNVNFDEMNQTNVTHPNRTQRQIRRNA